VCWNKTVTRLQAAQRIAEAAIDLLRVRHARCQILRVALDDPNYEPKNALKARTNPLTRLASKLLDRRMEESGKTASPNTVVTRRSRNMDPLHGIRPQKLTETERAAACMQEIRRKARAS
jgi:hypothetical protein